LIGIIILFAVEDIRWFLFYLLIILLITSERRTDYLRKLARAYQVMNEGKLVSIIRKLGITDEELQELGDETENNLTEEQRKSLYQDMSDLGLK
jgi:hypothetical protein